MTPNAILFDWDDTLAQTHALIVEAMEYVLQKYGKEPWAISKVKYRDTSKSVKDNFPNFFGEKATQAYANYVAYYTEIAHNKVIPQEGAGDFLRLCRQRNIALYIVSNKEKSLLLKEVAFCFPDIDFVSVFGDGDALRNKPYPDLVYIALAHADYEINKDNVWLIGDSKQDTECAYNAGIQPILLGKGNFMDSAYINDKTKANPPLLMFNNFHEIMKMLQLTGSKTSGLADSV